MVISRSPSPSPPPTPFRRRTKSCARKCERGCCAVATYFPLAFVYSLTTWAVYVEGAMGLFGDTKWWAAKPVSLFGILLYLLLNASYTIAVFTDPGSPLQTKSAGSKVKYSTLPTVEPSHDSDVVQPITVSSTGAPRYCKKCQTSKPDRTHHCSTCRRCVLKMDHHCPWLATCVGLHNYKAFILFLVYTSLFCWVCFGSSSWWIWTEVFQQNQYLEDFAPVNIILLAVISGIIGLVLTGFTAWHLYLCVRGQTTIECLEKTRYLSGVRRRVERQRQDQLQHHRRGSSHGVADGLRRAGEHILEFHANAIPGASRLEEGEERTSPALDGLSDYNRAPPHGGEHANKAHDSPALQALRRNYSSAEEQRERDRYEEYIDDKASEKLPNAFDLGWRRNLLHLLGSNPLLWALPVCNTTGDGWRWEVSAKWVQATEEVARRREANAHITPYHESDVHLRGGNAYDLESGRQEGMSMQTLNRPGHAWAKARQKRDFDQGEGDEGDHYEVSTDEERDESWRNKSTRSRDRRKSDEDGWRQWE
jgi:palmitoyltransferase ZDHHC2/15/20